MSNSEDFPPVPFVRQLCIHCPEAIYTYDLLWSAKDKEGFVRIAKANILEMFLMSEAKLVKHLLILCRMGLCNIITLSLDEDIIELELVLWSEMQRIAMDEGEAA